MFQKIYGSALTLSVALSLLAVPTKAQPEGWFVFNPSPGTVPSLTDMHDWLDRPAGRHGFLTMQGADYRFEDGTPVKFWGVNIAGNEPFSNRDKVDAWVPFIARHGINAVRFHKFTWDATDGVHSTELRADLWRHFDYFSHRLREAGVYYAWSHIYGHRVLPADSSRLLAYHEVRNTQFPWTHLNGTTSSLVNFAEDLQALNIELTVNMLNHVNPLTGKRYADDPALAFIELQNEDNIYWGAIERALEQTPTYRNLLCQKFSIWLRHKYGTDQALRKAWQQQGLAPEEHLDSLNIYPHPNHDAFSHAYEKALAAGQPVAAHVADRATFLYEEQRKFYHRFVAAIRQTGYRGVIVGSCWQAGSGITHFYNLHNDYEVGPIDRHNYFGGGSGHTLKTGPFDNISMLTEPGSGLLSTGLQQVADRPFQISEWMSLIPTEWIAESAPLIATYGLGLQGWDGSFSFAMDYPHYTNTVQSGHGVYNVTSPTHLALYPALAAMIYRGDVHEGPVVAHRHISLDALAHGELPLAERTTQDFDVKSFRGAIDNAWLAAGKVTLGLNEARQGIDSQNNYENLWNQSEKWVRSATGQLTWHYGAHRYVAVNTPGTQGMMGFAAHQPVNLADMVMTSQTDFAVILVTSRNRFKGISESKSLLVTTIARARNHNMTYHPSKSELLQVGEAPIYLEPVDWTLQLTRGRPYQVHVLDHAGVRTGKVLLPSPNGTLSVSGRQSKALYYEITFLD
ncbi:MAG: hypothetical protein ACOYXA_01640 [Bacteroidota bacterium]